MCTLTVAYRQFDAPLAVAANRDELYARPSSPPHRWEDPDIFAPRDDQAGGTWTGTNDDGVLVAITNRWSRDVTDGDRSRGLLVRDALAESSAEAAGTLVRRELDARAYEPFHLLVADRERALLFEHDATDSETRLAPGTYVVGNAGWCGVRASPDDAGEPQRTRSFFVPAEGPNRGREQAANDEAVLDALVESETATATAWLDRAGEILGDHEYGVCIHGEEFGTKSATLVEVGETATWRYADGPPCETPFQRYGPDGRV
ncbi:NRDE family protein [Halosegnis longus]|uniref:NRDE family protein n=1 Tax=Halosegnis longus TaxID=2216012 RepID=UPI00096A6DBF|nr:NRDE family protein [Salella cibi]